MESPQSNAGFSHRNLVLSSNDLNSPNQNRRNPSTPLGSIQFLNSLVQAISSELNLRKGFHVVPDGAMSSDSRDLFRESEVLEYDSPKIDKIQYSDLLDLGERSCEFLVSTLPIFGSPVRPLRPDEVIRRIVETACRLSEDGIGVLMTPSFYRSIRIGRLMDLLSAKGIQIIGLINTPPMFLEKALEVNPMFMVVSRKISETCFALDCHNNEDLTLNILGSLNHLDTGDLRTGIEIDVSTFKGFEHWYAQKEIEALEGDYTKYARFTLTEVSLFINLVRTREEFDDIPNSIYLPMIGNGEAVSSLQKTTMKHQNYCQIVVDTSIAMPGFLSNFLNTRHFRLYLEAEKVTKSQTIPKLNLSQVCSLPIALPDLETQHKISHNIAKLGALRSMVDELVQNISVNPVSSNAMTKQVDEALNVFGRLSIEDQLYSLLVRGESKTVEFKQTFSLDVSDNTKKPYLEDMVIKTIAAFLNSDGGDLLVGVSDEGQVTGIQHEIQKLHRGSRDNFLKHFKNILKTRIGEQFYPIVTYDIFELNDELIFHVNCRPSEIEVFVDGNDFYIRTNPATDKIIGKKLIDYVKQRFHTAQATVLG